MIRLATSTTLATPVALNFTLHLEILFDAIIFQLVRLVSEASLAALSGFLVTKLLCYFDGDKEHTF